MPHLLAHALLALTPNHVMELPRQTVLERRLEALVLAILALRLTLALPIRMPE